MQASENAHLSPPSLSSKSLLSIHVALSLQQLLLLLWG
jgi:hypothetical protein